MPNKLQHVCLGKLPLHEMFPARMLATFLQKCSQHFGLGTIGGKNVAHDSLFHQYIYIYIYIYIYTYIHIYICIYIEPNTPISLDVVFHFIHFTTYCVPFHYVFHFNIHCSEAKNVAYGSISLHNVFYFIHFTTYCVPFHFTTYYLHFIIRMQHFCIRTINNERINQ